MYCLVYDGQHFIGEKPSECITQLADINTNVDTFEVEVKVCNRVFKQAFRQKEHSRDHNGYTVEEFRAEAKRFALDCALRYGAKLFKEVS